MRCAYCHNPDSWHRHDGTPTPVADVLADIARYRGFLRHGGVTLSGGEPLAQPRFVKALLRGCKAMGLHTALDTSGYLGAQVDDAMLADLDLVLLDIKAFSARRYKRLTGVELEPTLAFARRLAAAAKPVVLRYVLVPGWTDREDDIAALARFAAGLGNVQRVDVLPFHQLGEHKWRERGLSYRLAGVEPPSDELAERTRSLFRAAGLQAS
ncbi:MAG: pyruvate formate-lyase-activating protein [Comamonadaceae bacterium]|nr:pyruvate formate-lyase-activating protein [Comamonadaceae bacterium]